MVDLCKQLIANQYLAALSTLNDCVERCPEGAWDAPVANHLFCQVAFHTLFYADHYLESSSESFRRQPFHLDHPQFFRDYEELEDRKPVLRYDRPSIMEYMGHCRAKVSQVMASETAESLAARSGFERLDFSRAELHVYNIRHIQHHAAQLILRLRLDYSEDIPWFKTGWCDV